MNIPRFAAAIIVATFGVLADASMVSAQFTWHDIERAVRPQDLPPVFREPKPNTQAKITDPAAPSYMEKNYRLEIENKSGVELKVHCIALKDGNWTGSWDHVWTVKPNQTTWLINGNNQNNMHPVLGSKFRIYAESGDNVWGDKDKTFDAGKPYETTGGTKLHKHTFNR